MLNYDIYYHVIQIGIRDNKINVRDFKNLKLVSRTFKYITTRHEKLFAYMIMAKYLRNCKHKLLHTFYNENRKIDGHSIGSAKSLWTLWTLPGNFYFYSGNISETYQPSFIQDITCNFRDNKGVIARHGDIVSSFIIIGNGIKKITLVIGGVNIHSQYFIDAKMVNFQPIVNGIYLISLKYHEVRIDIDCDLLKNVYGRYVMLDAPERRQLCQQRNRVNVNNYKVNYIEGGMYKSW